MVVVIIPTEPNANPAAKIYFFMIIFLRKFSNIKPKLHFFGRVFFCFFPCQKYALLQFLVKTNARFCSRHFHCGISAAIAHAKQFRVSTSNIQHPTSNFFQYFKIFSTASANSSLGINWSSSFLLNGIGVSIEATRKIGASKSSKQC